ncbi:hypothetical protein QBC44DRAFT_332224 [Cladorrhinum sp. PSN332]|nr:hypothetical protein QBC44DRAFT_332224 [Cladorrhinum sp. PSN332]
MIHVPSSSLEVVAEHKPNQPQPVVRYHGPPVPTSINSSITYVPEPTPTPPPPPPPPSEPPRGFCGLKPKTIAGLCVIFLASVVLAIGLGAGLSNAKKQTDPATSFTPSSTLNLNTLSTGTPSPTITTTTLTIPTPDSLPLECPALTNQKETITLGLRSWTFNLTCGMDIYNNGQNDILAIIVYTLRDCLQACASYNRNHPNLDNNSNTNTVETRDVQIVTGKCVAAVFNRRFASSLNYNYGSCWLKNSTAGA